MQRANCTPCFCHSQSPLPCIFSNNPSLLSIFKVLQLSTYGTKTKQSLFTLFSVSAVSFAVSELVQQPGSCLPVFHSFHREKGINTPRTGRRCKAETTEIVTGHPKHQGHTWGKTCSPGKRRMSLS